MTMLRVVTLVGVLVTVSHTHPHNLGCGVSRSMHGGRQLLREVLPRCLTTAKPSSEVRTAFKHCAAQVKQKLSAPHHAQKTDSLNLATLGVEEALREQVVECVVGRLELSLEGGALDTAKLLDLISTIDGDDFGKVLYLRAVMTSCVVNNPSDVNATQHLIELIECVRKEAADFCDTSLSLAKLWIQGDGAMSACSAVAVAPQYGEACSACANTLGVNAVAACGESMGGSPQESDATTTPAYTSTTTTTPAYTSTTTTTASTPTSTITTTTPNALTNFKQNMVAAVQLCAGEKLGWYSKENGIKPVALRDFIANFSGWEDIPEELANVTDAIVNCEPKINEEGGVNTLLVRGTLWSACFYPKYFSTCGFRSNLTMMLFPGYHQQMQKEVEQFMSQIIDFGDDTLDHDQPQGHEDAEMVDAGLLEVSPEKNEEVSEITDVDMERDVEAMSAENLHPPPSSAQMKGKEAQPSKDSHHKSVHTSIETSSQREKSTENPSETSSEKPAESSSEKPAESSGASEVTTAEELTDNTMGEEETVGQDGATEATTQTGA